MASGRAVPFFLMSATIANQSKAPGPARWAAGPNAASFRGGSVSLAVQLLQSLMQLLGALAGLALLAQFLALGTHVLRLACGGRGCRVGRDLLVEFLLQRHAVVGVARRGGAERGWRKERGGGCSKNQLADFHDDLSSV